MLLSSKSSWRLGQEVQDSKKHKRHLGRSAKNCLKRRHWVVHTHRWTVRSGSSNIGNLYVRAGSIVADSGEVVPMAGARLDWWRKTGEA